MNALALAGLIAGGVVAVGCIIVVAILSFGDDEGWR